MTSVTTWTERVPWLHKVVGPLSVGDWLSVLARVILAIAWAWAGLVKIGSPLQAQRAAQAFQLRNLPGFGWLTWEMEGAIGLILPIVEVFLAVLILVGLFTRYSAIASMALFAVFIFGITSVWIRGIHIDCGCFGGGGQVDPGKTQYPQEILRDIGFMLCGLWLVVWNRFPFSVDAWLQKRGTAS